MEETENGNNKIHLSIKYGSVKKGFLSKITANKIPNDNKPTQISKMLIIDVNLSIVFKY